MEYELYRSREFWIFWSRKHPSTNLFQLEKGILTPAVGPRPNRSCARSLPLCFSGPGRTCRPWGWQKAAGSGAAPPPSTPGLQRESGEVLGSRALTPSIDEADARAHTVARPGEGEATRSRKHVSLFPCSSAHLINLPEPSGSAPTHNTLQTLNCIQNTFIPTTSKDGKGHLCELYQSNISRTLVRLKNVLV